MDIRGGSTDNESGGMAERGSVMDDQLNVPLEDAELLAEVELTTNLIIAASEAAGSLTQAEVDELLGVAGGDPLAPVVPLQKVRDRADALGA